MKEDNNLRRYMEQEAFDIAKGATKGIISNIPCANLCLSIVESLKEGAYKRRYEDWQENVNRRLKELEEQVFKTLGDNDNFATAFAKATQMVATTNKEKMEYLANAVAYCAKRKLSEDILIVFFNCLEKYTISHISLLEFLRNPQDKLQIDSSCSMTSTIRIFEMTKPKFDFGLSKIIVRDLYSDGFIDADNLTTTTSYQGCISKRTTDLGDNFLKLIGV